MPYPDNMTIKVAGIVFIICLWISRGCNLLSMAWLAPCRCFYVKLRTEAILCYDPFMKLMPTQSVFFELFLGLGKDLRELNALFSEFADSFTDFREYADRAHAIERNADEKIHRVINELNTSFITPFDREDVYALAHELDDVIDLLEDVIRSVHLYRVHKKIPAMATFAKLIAEDTKHLYRMLELFAQMKHTPELLQAKIHIHELEDRGDDAFEEAITALFEDCTDPIELIKTKDILEKMEMVMDAFQDVSNLIEGIIIKST